MEAIKLGDILPGPPGPLNQAPAKPVLTPSLPGDLLPLAEALKTKRLERASREEFDQLLRGLFMMVGLRAANLPTVMETEFLIAFAVRNFGACTLGEVSLAFELAIGRRLDIRSEDVIVYENFTVEYFGRIMSAYRSWANPRATLVVQQRQLEKEANAAVSKQQRMNVSIDYALYLHCVMCQKRAQKLMLLPLRFGLRYDLSKSVLTFAKQ